MKINKILGMFALAATMFLGVSCNDVYDDNQVPAIQVNGIDVTVAGLNNGNLTLLIGQTQVITVAINPADAANQDVFFMSTDPDVASINATVEGNGLIEAVGNGTATIVVSSVADPNINYQFDVTVADEVLPQNDDDKVNQNQAWARQK